VHFIYPANGVTATTRYDGLCRVIAEWADSRATSTAANANPQLSALACSSQRRWHRRRSLAADDAAAAEDTVSLADQAGQIQSSLTAELLDRPPLQSCAQPGHLVTANSLLQLASSTSELPGSTPSSQGRSRSGVQTMRKSTRSVRHSRWSNTTGDRRESSDMLGLPGDAQ
jgi:hypothetical protein